MSVCASTFSCSRRRPLLRQTARPSSTQSSARMPTWSRPTSCELHAVMHLPHACYVPSWHEARSLTRTLLPSRHQWPRLLSSISIRSDKVYGAETAYGGTAQFTRVAQLATQGYQGHGGGRHSSLQARVHLPRMRCLESDAFTSTHTPLVMKLALLEEFPPP